MQNYQFGPIKGRVFRSKIFFIKSVVLTSDESSYFSHLEFMSKNVVNYCEKWYTTTAGTVQFNGNIEHRKWNFAYKKK